MTAYNALSVASRHVLAGMVLQRNDPVWNSAELYKLRCSGVFDPETETSSVITELCNPPEACSQPFCINEDQEKFSTVLDRLRLVDLKEIGKRCGVKVSVFEKFFRINTDGLVNLGKNSQDGIYQSYRERRSAEEDQFVTDTPRNTHARDHKEIGRVEETNNRNSPRCAEHIGSRRHELL
ncbi:hypothetical protein FB451DRAFT_172505 [Mycena latifolia]|nr:hypothetical protein FB451DRAFT_172505 [Mycena latifolia]